MFGRTRWGAVQWVVLVAIVGGVLLRAGPSTGFLWAGQWTSGGPYGGNVRSLSMSISDADITYAGTNTGVYKTVNGGGTWTEAGLAGFSVRCVRVDPSDPDIVYAGTASTGLHKSENGGNSWTLKDFGDQRVEAIAIDPSNSNVLFAAVGWGPSDIYRSPDGGDSWTIKRSGGPTERVNCILVNPENSTDIFVASTGGLHQSTNGGDTWVDKDMGGYHMISLAITPAGHSPQMIYAVSRHPSASWSGDLYKSADLGENWINVGGDRLSRALTTDPFYPDWINVGANSATDPLYAYYEPDDTWQYVPESRGLPGGSPYCIQLSPDPQKTHSFVGYSEANSTYWNPHEGGGLYRHVAGTDWSRQPILNAGIHDLAILPGSPSEVIAAVYGWSNHLAKTMNGGSSWAFLTDSPKDRQAVTYDPQTHIIYAGFPYRPWGPGFHYLDKSSDGGQTWGQTGAMFWADAQLGVFDIWVSPTDSDTILVAIEGATFDGAGVHKSINGGVSWSRTHPTPAFTLGADPNNDSVVYFGSQRCGYVMRSTDRGSTWVRITEPPSPEECWVWEVRDIEVDLDSDVYVATGEGLWKWDGTDWVVLAGLPTDDLTALAIDRSSSPGTVYVGTKDAGVCVSEDAGLSWVPVNDGLGNLSITKLIVSDTGPRILYAGTAFGGVWGLNLSGACYALTPSHTGNGVDPVATPPNSIGCPEGQYYAGEQVGLDSSPGADPGWTLCSWIGTDDDGRRSEQNTVTMPTSSHTVAVNYVSGGAESCGAVPDPIAIELIDFTAIESNGQVELQWETGYEVDNLGFHLYREDASGITRITPSLVAGSALLTGTVLSEGFSYLWTDPDGNRDSLYWLEDIDTDSTVSRYGPVRVVPAVGRNQAPVNSVGQSLLLSQLGRDDVDPVRPMQRADWDLGAEAERLEAQRSLATRQAVKIPIQQEGLYRVSGRELWKAGLSTDVNPDHLRLYSDGAEVPLLVGGGEDGRLDEQDELVFYGFGRDTNWTDSRVYWLVEDATPGRRMSIFASSGGLPIDSFTQTLEWRPRTTYYPGLSNGTEEENFFGLVLAGDSVEQVFRLDHLAADSTESARLELRLQGVRGDHRIIIRLNHIEIGRLVFQKTAVGEVELEIPPGLLVRGENTVTLESFSGQDVSLVNRVRLSHPRQLHITDDRLQLEVEAGSRITLEGFLSQDILVADVTDPSRVHLLGTEIASSETGFTATVTASGSGQRRLLAATYNSLLEAAEIRLDRTSRWHEEQQGGEVVILTHRDLEEALKPLQEYRQKQGYSVVIVDVEDLYDEYAFGQKRPHALRAFLQEAVNEWEETPRWLLLAGDASFDPRGYLGYAEEDRVPTWIETAGPAETARDDWFADVDGDGWADLAVGRLPLSGLEETEAVVEKILDYEQQRGSEDWQRRVLFIADEQGDFEFSQESTKLAERIPESLRVDMVSRSQLTEVEKLHRQLEEGHLLVNYLGHGSVGRWAGQMLTAAVAEQMANGTRAPLVLSMSCLTGRFHGERKSLAEALVKNPSGGAVAMIASASLDGARGQVRLNDALLQGVFSDEKLTLGEMLQRAKRKVGGPAARSYLLLGDPLLRLKSGPSQRTGWKSRRR